MSHFLLGVIAILYLIVSAQEAFLGDYAKALLLLCYAAANVMLIFVRGL